MFRLYFFFYSSLRLLPLHRNPTPTTPRHLVINPRLRAQLLLLAAVYVWGLRLSCFLAYRNWGQPEDHRYQAFRRYYGPQYWWISFFQVFLLQASFSLVVSAPLYAAQASATPSSLTSLDLVGVFLVAYGVVFEAVADAQLLRFKSHSRRPDDTAETKVLRTGLWGYCRHPNYFGEAVVWCGFASFAAATRRNWWSLGGSAFMIFLLLKVSGVPLLEKALKRSKPAYAAYIASVPAFVPRRSPVLPFVVASVVTASVYALGRHWSPFILI